MITGVVELLRCPHCRSSFAVADRLLRCRQGHAFDIAKQGYVNLTGTAQPAHADTSAMVTARAELLASGRYRALTEALVDVLPVGVGTLLDVGTGTGHYAAAILDDHPAARCLGLDVSVVACRRAARAHPRLGVVTCDAWGELPVVDSSLDLVLSVFSPRNPAEFARVLRPGGSVITVTPRPDHLVELRSALGLLGVEGAKQGRLTDALGRVGLTRIDQRDVHRRDPWSLEDAVRSILMGPNAFHTTPNEVRALADRQDWPHPVTIACVISRWGS